MLKKLKILFLIIVFFSTPTVAFDPTTTVTLLKQLTEMRNQIQLMKDQYSQLTSVYSTLTEQYQAIQDLTKKLTKVSSLEDVLTIMNDSKLNNIISKDLKDLASEGKKLAEQATTLPEKSASQTMDEYYAMYVKKTRGKKIQRHGTNLVLARKISNSSKKRLELIEKLKARVEAAKSAQEVSNLQALIQVENLKLQNEAMKLNALKIEQNSIEKLEQEQAHKLAVEFYKKKAKYAKQFNTFN